MQQQMLKLSSILGVFLFIGTPTPAQSGGGIPYPSALAGADVTVPSMLSGHRDGLIVGNGDLYGLVWERDGVLTLRVTKNDIWDARLDTSADGELPRVDVATGEVSGSQGVPPSYGRPYPQPRCAAALRLEGESRQSVSPRTCIRGAPEHGLDPLPGYPGSVMVVGGARGASTGYSAQLRRPARHSICHLRLSGTPNASFYVNLYDDGGKPILESGWKPSPSRIRDVELSFAPSVVARIEVFTMTSDGERAENRIERIWLSGEGAPTPIDFSPPHPGAQGTLDLRRAVATITRPDSSTTTIRVLADRNVVLIHGSSPVTLDPISAETLPPARTGETDGLAWLRMDLPGDVDYAGMSYALAVAREEDRTAVSLVTSFDPGSGDVLERAIALARDTIAGDESELIAAHERTWEEFWSRSGVQLADKDFQNWWYRLLYFARAISRPGAAPPALMPPLATDATPWHADFHYNYNAWQAFWPLPAANHSDLADSWISYLNDMLPRFQFLSRVTYGIDGAFVPISSFLHEPDPADCKSKNKRQISINPYGMTIGMVGMTLQSMWQKHLLDPDREYMQAKIYPFLKEGAKFYVAFMEQCKKDDSGKILLGPSYSPEHGSMGIYNCPFDIAYTRYTLDAFIQASAELGIDEELAAQCRKYTDLLADYPTNEHDGEEVVVDWEGGPHIDVHNITVPAVPVFPGDQVTWFSPDPVKELFKRTIRHTRYNGNNSHVMYNIAKARLSMPDAVSSARSWFKSREAPNGLFVWQGHYHGTFMPESIGIAGLIDEFLVQSVGGILRVFPCWPKELDASFTGLRAQGGYLVSATQREGDVVKIEITPSVSGELRLLSPWSSIEVNGKILEKDRRGVVTLNAVKDEVLVFEEALSKQAR